METAWVRVLGGVGYTFIGGVVLLCASPMGFILIEPAIEGGRNGEYGYLWIIAGGISALAIGGYLGWRFL